MTHLQDNGSVTTDITHNNILFIYMTYTLIDIIYFYANERERKIIIYCFENGLRIIYYYYKYRFKRAL